MRLQLKTRKKDSNILTRIYKTFAQMMEQLGYDIELTYVKKTK